MFSIRAESIKRPDVLTELEVDLVVELTEPEGELLGAGDARRRLGQVRSHVLGAVRTGVESAMNGRIYRAVWRMIHAKGLP